MEAFRKIDAASPVDQSKPRAWIQWKGTNVCADIHCACGAHGHVDDYFAYTVKCGKCGQLWGMDPHVTLVALEPPDVVGMCEPRDTHPDSEGGA